METWGKNGKSWLVAHIGAPLNFSETCVRASLNIKGSILVNAAG